MDRRKFISTAAAGVAALGMTRSASASPWVVFKPGVGDPSEPPAAVPTLSLEASRPSPELLARAYRAYSQHQASVGQRDLMAIADFSAPSRQPRFHLLNMLNGKSTAFLVAHGKGSDPGHSGWLQSFSNMPGSEASSSGAYIVGDIYYGEHGQSRRLQGLDADNNAAERRAIVIHPAWYVSQDIAAKQGKIGRSQGCFAFSDADIGEILARLDTGTLLYADKA